jgi:hypothetical protein
MNSVGRMTSARSRRPSGMRTARNAESVGEMVSLAHTVPADSLKALDLDRPVSEADIGKEHLTSRR